MHAVGIDVGTTNTKLALVEIEPDRARVENVAAAPTPEPAALAGTVRALLRRVLDGGKPPDAIGIASMAETGVPLDDSGTPLGSWLRWDGHRAQAEADELSRRLGWAELVAATGVRPSAKVPLATWAWLAQHRPDVWAATARWAGVADLTCLLLSGVLATDHTLAGRTMAYRLPRDGRLAPQFDADLLAEVGLRPEQLPAVVAPDWVAGHTTAAFADCGLPAGTPVVLAGHDHAVGAFAAGVRAPGDVADSVGTAEALLSIVPETPDPVEVATAGMSTVVTVGGRHAAVLGGSSSAGAVVAWWLEHEAAGLDPDELFAQVDALDDRPSDVLVLPYLSGRQTPAPDPSARLEVLGRGDHTPAQLALGMLEGLCLQSRWMLDTQGRFTGPARGITALGAALTANPAWLRVKAAVLPQPLRIVTALEPVAAGAALVAAARAGRMDVPALEHRPAPQHPDPRYDESFARFVAAATRIRGDA